MVQANRGSRLRGRRGVPRGPGNLAGDSQAVENRSDRRAHCQGGRRADLSPGAGKGTHGRSRDPIDSFKSLTELIELRNELQ